MTESIAHIRKSDGKRQTVEEHLQGVQRLASRYGRTIGVEHLAGLAGILHDMGKYSDRFRNYILEAVSHPEDTSKRGTVDHSTAGGKLLYEAFHSEGNNAYEKMLSEMVGNAIISHHGGLQDFLSPELTSDYLNRVKEKAIEDFQIIVEAFHQQTLDREDFQDYVKQGVLELNNFLKQNINERNGQKFFLILTFLTKYLFSCLIDADRTDTRCFEERTSPNIESQNEALFQVYYDKLTAHLSELNAGSHAQTKINQLRAEMSQQCDDFASKPSGIYTLSIPTGGGKTLASLRYALKHAVEHNKDRIVYVVPYTTIIEQNAETVKSILEDREHILEHHSNVIEEDSDTLTSLKLAKDNWEAPIIFTTMVQFLNAFYDKGTRNVRRLHNLANAVIIFDEVQSVPIKCVSLFNEAVNFLKGVGHSSILLCTATQPALDFVKNNIEKIDGEIVQDLPKITDAFKRVEIVDKTTNLGWGTEELSDFVLEQLQDKSSVLVILNTKTVVRRLFNYMKENNNDPDLKIFHLSTSMCAAHRTDILSKVKKAMKCQKKVICLSTQLIEAGVDISFECVIRSLAGLDSIAQAAGRCNRHGEYDSRNVYVMNHREENLQHLKEIKKGADITQTLLYDRGQPEGFKDLLSPEALGFYFQSYYDEMKKDLDYSIPALQKNMFDLLQGGAYKQAYSHKEGKAFGLMLDASTKTAASYFKVIDNQTTSLLVPYGDEGREFIAEFNGEITPKDMTSLLKKAQKYTVNVYQYEFDRLNQGDNIHLLLDGKLFCLNEKAYDINYGVNIEGDGVMETPII